MSEKIKENLKKIYCRLKMNFHNGNVMKVLFICSVVIILYNCLDVTAHASGMLDYGSGKSPFEGVSSGWGQFMSEKFRNNYALDAGDTSFIDISKILNAVANLVFWIVVNIAWLTLNVFNLCFNSNIPDQFASILNKVSSAFNGLFDRYFMIMFMISVIMFVVSYAKRNYAAIFRQFLATVVIMASVAIISSTGVRDFVVDTTDFTRNMGASIVSSINNTDNDGFSEDGSPTSEMLGTMWANLVHKPWVILEFNGTKSLEDKDSVELSKQILSKDTEDDEREKLAEENIKNVSFAARAGTTIVLGLITIIKCFVIMVLGVLQVFFQILAIGIVLIAPLMFLLAVVPFFGGMNLVKWLGRKYLDVQFGIVLLSFGIAMLVLIDNILLTFFMSVGASFVVAMLIQCLCWVLVIVFRKQIMDSLKSLQEKVSSVSGSPLNLGDKLLDKGAGVGRNALEPMKRKVVDFRDLASANARYAKTYMKGKAGIYKAKKVADTIDKARNRFTSDLTENQTETKSENLNRRQYGGEKLDIDKLKVRKNENENSEKINDTSIPVNIKDKLDVERDKEQDGVNFEKINDSKNDEKLSNERENNKKIKDNSTPGVNINDKLDVERDKEQDGANFEKINDNKNDKKLNSEKNDKKLNSEKNDKKLSNEREKEEHRSSVNLTGVAEKNNSNKNENKERINSEVDREEKVVSLNDKRVEKGISPVDDDKIKNEIRENLNRETVNNEKEIKNDKSESNTQQKEAEKIVNEKRKESKKRAEKLKKVLGVDKKKIRAREVKLRKDLGSIRREKMNIKNRN